MIGSNILYYPSQFSTAFDAGHDIADHTFTHPYLTTKNNLDIVGEVSFCPTGSEPGKPTRINNNQFSLDGQCYSSPILPEAVSLNFGDHLMVIQMSGLAPLPKKSVLFFIQHHAYIEYFFYGKVFSLTTVVWNQE